MERLQQEFEANSFPQTYRWCVRRTTFWYYGQDQAQWLSTQKFCSVWKQLTSHSTKRSAFFKNRSKLFGQMVDKSTQIKPKSRRPKRCLPIPKNVRNVHRFLGMVNHLGKFLQRRLNHCKNSSERTMYGCGASQNEGLLKKSDHGSCYRTVWPNQLVRQSSELMLHVTVFLILMKSWDLLTYNSWLLTLTEHANQERDGCVHMGLRTLSQTICETQMQYNNTSQTPRPSL